MINLRLIRKYFKKTYTVGSLYIGDDYLCDTLEDEVREDKIPGETAIPYGRYRVILRRSPKFGRELPAILNVDNFTNILIHAGNNSDDTSGCILVGENKIRGCLVRSRYWEAKLMDRIKERFYNGEEIYINII